MTRETDHQAGRRNPPAETDLPARMDRRGFLRTVGGVSAVAAAAVPLAPEPAAAQETNDEKRKARYRESDHVKTFYRTNRY